jgi:hypothetical protein
LIEELEIGGIPIRIALEGSAVAGFVVHILNFKKFVAKVSDNKLLFFTGATLAQAEFSRLTYKLR